MVKVDHPCTTKFKRKTQGTSDRRTNIKQVERGRTQKTEQVMVTVPEDTTCEVYNENIKRRKTV